MKSKMLRALALFLAALTLFAVVSCDKKPNDVPTDTQGETVPETEPVKENPYKDMTLVMASDIHLCHLDWYGMKNADRVQKFIDDLNDFYDDEGYDAILYLGDYSLDYWETGNFGSWRHRGVSNTYNFLKQYAARLTCPDYYILPGNHEQYGEELWEELSGSDLGRQFYRLAVYACRQNGAINKFFFF